MKNFLLILVLLTGFVFQGNTQKLDYERTSPYFLGLNLGHTWHTSDVQNVKMSEKFTWGAGVVAGRTFNRDYGKLLSYDLRLRYLGGGWYGRDRDTTSFLTDNSALKPMLDTVGFATKNFKSRQHSLDLEFTVHWNRLTENTGIDPYIFGGIGIVGTKTEGALTSDPNLEVNDLTFNTPLDMNGDGENYQLFDVNVLPSLGVGIGYYFNSSFSLGIEHRTTFFNSDYFDGTTINASGNPSKTFEKDLYHYTSIYFKWYLKPRVEKEIKDPIVPDNNVIIDNPNVPDAPIRPPHVNFTQPANNTHTESAIYDIEARLQYVDNPQRIMFTQNGNGEFDFTFDPTTGVFKSRVNLAYGENIFYIAGYNNDGNDSDQIIIIREDKRIYPPIVNIVDPASSPHRVSQLQYTVQANIQNIQGRNQLNVTFNGYNFTDYTFTADGNINFLANLNLQAGTNTLTIVGTNEAGTDSDQTVFIYERTPVQPKNPPIVNITSPSSSPYTSANNSYKVEANVFNVNYKNQIEVQINGSVTTNFTYNSLNNKIEFIAPLQEGSNIVYVKATNSDGVDSDQTQILYNRVKNPPVVRITNPNSNISVNTDTYGIVASITNVSSKNQIEVRINGIQTTNFTYNVNTKQLNFNASLIPGINNIHIIATNNDGSDSDEKQISYRVRKEQPPIVDITSPNVNPFQSINNGVNVKASVLNVTTKSQIEVRINGFSTTDFTYNGSTNQVDFLVSLNEGNNVVSVKATNDVGADSDEIIVNYKKAVNPPTVNITTPSENPFTVNQNSSPVVASVVGVSDKNQIVVKVNGVNLTNFTYNQSTKQVHFVASLNLGLNTVYVQAVNEGGQDFDQTQIIYQRSSSETDEENVGSGFKPTVTITIPSVNPYTTVSTNENVSATVTGVNNKNQITVKVNNTTVSNFTFDATTRDLMFNTDLIVGENNIEITGTNTFGSTSGQTKIIRQVINLAPPKISFINPANPGVSTKESEFTLRAKIENITSKNAILLHKNGAQVEPSLFSYDAQTKMLEFATSLVLNKNTFVITAINNDGSDQAETNVILTLKTVEAIRPDGMIGKLPNPCNNHPEIQIVSPDNSPFTSEMKGIEVKVKLTNITSKDQIEVYLNNQQINVLNFNSSTGEFSQFIGLNEGENTYKVVATNDCSSKEEVIIINFEEPKCSVIDNSANGELCIVTPTGSIDLQFLLENPNFTYNGPSTSIYFKPLQEGEAKIGTTTFTVLKENFYHFSGNQSISLKRVNRLWEICIDAEEFPKFGNGERKPANPCVSSTNIEDGKEEVKPVIKPRPDFKLSPNSKPDTQEDGDVKPNIQTQPSPTTRMPSREINKPAQNPVVSPRRP